MKMLQKIINNEYLENYQKKVYDGVFFNKVAYLYCTDLQLQTSSFSINIL